MEVKWIALLKFDVERGHGSMRYLSSKQTVTKGQAKRWKARHERTPIKKTKTTKKKGLTVQVGDTIHPYRQCKQMSRIVMLAIKTAVFLKC